MRLAETLTIPEKLETLRSEGNLVVFAGAGISIGQPANLPGFVDLARAIAEPAVTWDASDAQAIDRYLGRAERAGIRVHDRARAILSAAGGRHTPLHEHLVGLFGTADHVRLITTNFDPFFKAACQAVFPAASIPLYTGPALPLGREFRGVAQLHGALENTHESLVLTERDFGAAYLTDGWATRFLLGIFGKRIVLFAGYRLGDPVIQYLMSALPVEGRAYALCHLSESTAWADRGIEPITFDTAPNGERFADLNEGMQRWRWYAQASAVIHDTELRRIVDLGPSSLTPQDEDYLRVRLATEAGRTSFCSATKTRDWFDWASRQGFLEPLFDETAVPNEVQRWAGWSLTNFMDGLSPALLSLVRARSLKLNSTFAGLIAWHLWRTDPLPDAAIVRQCIALIANQSGSSSAFNHHVWLLQKLVEHNMLEESAALLRWLTRVRLKDLERYFLHAGDATEGELPSLSIGIEMDESSHLADHLEKHGAKLTELLGVQLLEIGEQRVREAYELMTLAHGRDDNFDWVSYGRTSIAPSNQDTIAHAEDVLVLMMRQSIDALAGVDPNRIHEFAERASLPHEPTLLRRLGIYALSRLTDVNRDDLLNRAMSLGWPRDVLLRPELYQLLRAHYEHATEAGRERLISDLDNDEWWQGDEYRDRKRFDLSQLFVRVAPNSATTVAFAERQRVQHPAWLEQDRDGFLARVEVGWGGDEPSPIDKETMLGWSAEQARTELARALQEAERSGIKQSILGTFQSAVQTDAEWGTRLFAHISTACSTSGEDAQLIDGISWALRERDLSPDERLTFLRLSAELQWPVSSAHSISSTLEQWSRKSGESKSVELYDAFDRAADAIFDRSRTSKPAIEHDGWFERAINHPAGLAAQIWLTIADTRDRLTGAFVLSTDEQELGRWQRVLNDNSLAGAHARPILGTATERIIAGDPDWAKRILLPRFDPAGGDSAAQLWDGRFFYSRWSWAFVNGVEPFWDEFLRDSRTIAPNRAEKLGDVIALLVAQRAQSHFTLERVLKFVQGTTDEGRRAFADAVPRHLAAITSDERRELWQELLLPYWRARRTNMPSALSPDEVREMITWAPALPEVASVVVSELAATETGPMNQAASIFWTWQEDDRFVREHPNEVLIIVRFLAERRSVDWFVAEAVKTIELAMKHGGKLDGAQAAAESLANATNADQAVDFARRLRGKNGE